MSASRVGLTLCLFAEAISFAFVAGAARAGQAPSTIIVGLGASFVPHVGVLIYSRALQDAWRPNALATLTAAFLGAIWLFAPPTLSDDIYRYAWEGQLWLEGLNPYRLAPNDPSLEPLRDELWRSINNKPLATIYPPLSQALFAVGAMLGGGVLGMQAFGLAALVASVAWTAKLTGNPRIALAIGSNPLLSSASVLDGHLDVLVGATVLTAAYALADERFVRGALAACAAVGLKVVGLVVLPFLRPRPKLLAGACALSALLLLPLCAARDPGDPASGAGQFVARWRGNESLFAAIDWFSQALLPESIADVVARIVVVLLVGAILLVVSSRRAWPPGGIRIVLWSVLLLSPQVHPWYLAWILPLDLAVGHRAALIWSAAALCAYVPLDRWLSDGVWEMPIAIQIAEYLAVALGLLFDLRSNSKFLQ